MHLLAGLCEPEGVYIYIYIFIDFVRHINLELCNPLSVLHHMARMGLVHCKGHKRQEEGDRERLVEFTLCSVCVSVCDCVSE